MTTAIAFSSETNIQKTSDKSLYDYKEPAWNRYHFLALLGFVGGAFAGILGLSLSIIAYFEAIEIHESLSNLGTMFVVATIPLLILGAHALDRIDDMNKARDRRDKEMRSFNKEKEIL